MLRGGTQHGDGAVMLTGVALQGADLAADLLGSHVAAAHFLAQRLSCGIGSFQSGLGSDLLLLGSFHIGLQLELGSLEILQLLQPHGDLQHTQLIAENEVLLGNLCLLAQRLNLQLKLGDLIVDAHQVLLRALQLTLGLLLAMAELGDTGGLFKNLAALTGLDGQNLVDLTLSDDGIALTTHTGVHEQLVHVLKAHHLLIDVILRLTAAVIAAGHRHLRLVAGEDMLGVVHHQRNLSKAHLITGLRTAEDHVLHLGTAELAAALLAHDPADSIGDVGLTRAVGAHDGGNIRTECQCRLIGKGFKSLYFQRFEIHAVHLSWIGIL